MEEDIPIEDLKPKEVRFLLNSYYDLITKNSKSSSGPRPKYNLYEVQKVTKIYKDISFFEEFFQIDALLVSLYIQCRANLSSSYV